MVSYVLILLPCAGSETSKDLIVGCESDKDGITFIAASLMKSSGFELVL
jgi:hypothetical protein